VFVVRSECETHVYAMGKMQIFLKDSVLGSQSVLHWSRGFCDHFPGDLWTHSCNGYFEVTYFL